MGEIMGKKKEMRIGKTQGKIETPTKILGENGEPLGKIETDLSTGGRKIIIGNTIREWTGTEQPEKIFLSYKDKKTAILSYRRKITYHSRRGEPLPLLSHGLSEKETIDLLKTWGFETYTGGYIGIGGFRETL